MVYAEDTGTLLDAPFDVVWEYLGSARHGRAHAGSLRNLRPETLTASSARVAAERRRRGRWETFVVRSTDLAPLCLLVEELESSTAGTKTVSLYSPCGDRTRVDVYADVRSDSLPPEEWAPETWARVEGAYREDREPLAEFARGRVGGPLAARRISDLGGRFDVPLEVVWEYLRQGSGHAAAHRSVRDVTVAPLAGSSFLLSAERRLGDRWAKETRRITTLPPLAVGVEWLEGDLAGSKAVSVYRPRGDRTEVDVHGEFVSATIPSGRLEPTVRSILETEFEEDAEPVRALAKSLPRGRSNPVGPVRPKARVRAKG